jgi:Flp pilus assembly protein TadB
MTAETDSFNRLQHPPPPRVKLSGEAPAGPRFNGYDPAAVKTVSRAYTHSPKSSSSSECFSHEEKRSVDARVTYLTEFELMNGKMSEVEVARPGDFIVIIFSHIVVAIIIFVVVVIVVVLLLPLFIIIAVVAIINYCFCYF